ncbi:MAG: transglutaminase domain-containing protein [Ferruginibacter sp.]
MKNLLAAIILSSFSICAAAQGENYGFVDSRALQIPFTETNSTTALATYIQANFTTEREKLRAAYTWIANNIQYNRDSMFYRYWGEDPERKLSSVLKTRKGVCENFASLLAVIASKCGIPAYVVNGYTKVNGFVNWMGHSWCAVSLNKEWFFCDPTWDYNFKTDANYFLIEPASFVSTHMPFDPIWQLLEQPVTIKEFKQGYTKGKGNPAYNYKDSITAFLQADTLVQMEGFSRRMKKAGIENDDLRTWYAYNEMKIFIVQQEKDMNRFNASVRDLNSAKILFNDFVQYRNNHMSPPRPDVEVNRLFNAVDSLLTAAYKKLDEVGKTVENFQYDTDGLKLNLDVLSAKVQLQKGFLKRYFAVGLAEREKLLYE